MSDGRFWRKNSQAAKLTAAKVQLIRELYASNTCTQGDLAREYGVSVTQIGRIVRGEVWQHLPEPPPTAQRLEESAKRMVALETEVKQLGLVPPPPEEDTGVLEALAAAIKRKIELQPDNLLNELKETKDESDPKPT